jgi:hypothetical protein
MSYAGRPTIGWRALTIALGMLVAVLGLGCSAIIETESPESKPPDSKAHWSFTAPVRPPLPRVMRQDWPKNSIDVFVLAKLEAQGLEPAPPAAAAALLRRVTLDLTGLPPTPAAVEAFSSDPSDAAYAAQVEQLLASPAFGEHRARYWLDIARYADTHGYHFDNYRSIWPYRDYVVEAFASGKPFDAFTIEQLAGDLLPSPTQEQRVATGFLRCGMTTSEGGVDESEYAAIYAKDHVETLGSAWLGLTVGCAACHDHRYDPITQKDFYQLTAFFRNTTQPVLDLNAADAPPSLQVGLGTGTAPTLVVEEKPGTPTARVLTRGRWDSPAETVTADVPASLPPLGDGEPRSRLGLARWLVRADHPLTARVTVNRFWAEVFGNGLVQSAHDFGRAGEAPSHPELLDWLAVELRESGWDVKHLFRLLVTSAAYRQSSQVTADKLEHDPDNRLLSRGPRFRMDAEMVRDLALTASDLLVRRVGGPSVRPYQPANVWDVVSLPESNTSIYEQETGEALYRRSLYTFWKRQAPPPSLEAFNAPSRERSVTRRERTNSPLQALVTLNDPQFVEAARVLATHAVQAETSTAARLAYMALRVLAREPQPEEALLMEKLLASQLTAYAADSAAAEALIHVGDSPPPAELRPSELAAWTIVASTLLNLDEALVK